MDLFSVYIWVAAAAEYVCSLETGNDPIWPLYLRRRHIQKSLLKKVAKYSILHPSYFLASSRISMKPRIENSNVASYRFCLLRVYKFENDMSKSRGNFKAEN